MLKILTVLVALLVLALGLWLAWLAISALKNGVAYAAGSREFRRNKNPLIYWTTVVVQSVFSVGCLYSVILCFQRLSR